MHEFFATAIPNTERALCDELRELGFSSVRLNRGGIPFRGEWRDGWRACLESRIAQRILLLTRRFQARTEQELYDGIRAIDWSPYLAASHTFAIRSVSVASQLRHSGFVALKAKDAIADQIRACAGERPNVSRDDPDVGVFVYLVEDRAAVYLDLSGEPLHRRGYRRQTGDAPLRETLAAAMLRMSGWNRTDPLIDPMCGSGTIAIEAAMWAANIAPGLSRGRFGFERWANFGPDQATELRSLCGALRRAIHATPPRIIAADCDESVLALAQANARAAGVKLTFRARSVLDLQGDEARVLVSNPPYGVRLDPEPDFPARLAATLSRLHGWRIGLLSGTPAYERAIHRKPAWTHPLQNGDLDCTFLLYEMP